MKRGIDNDNQTTEKKLKSMSSCTSAAVKLNETELQIFATIREILSTYELTTTIRVAGGWVRDKLLQRSDGMDIDLACDNITGVQFASYVEKFLMSKGQKMKGMGVIKINPEQSKHLETVTFRLHDVPIDVNNLRTETYNPDSRIPQMKIGTPTEDAMRRDFTINSLFFNINTGQVEDYTQKGLTDLAEGIIRTPLPAAVTFRDDPLRILRAVRFASRFGFILDDDIYKACADETIQKQLACKISRERIGTEIYKMFIGPSTVYSAFNTIHKLGLSAIVFALPPVMLNIPADSVSIERLRILVDILSNKPPNTCYLSSLCSKLDNYLRLLSMAAFLLPFHSLQYMDKKRKKPASFYVMRESLKFRSVDAEIVSNLVESVRQLYLLDIHNGVDATVKENTLSIAYILRSCGVYWPMTLLLYLIELQIHQPHSDTQLVDFVLGSHLEGVWQLKPLLNGNDILRILPHVKGAQMKCVMKSQLDWQIMHPEGSVKDLAETLVSEFVKQ